MMNSTSVNLQEEYENRQIQEVLDELEADLVGLVPVKERIKEVAALLLVHRLRKQVGLTSANPNLHMSFTGSPGTGKTAAFALPSLDYLGHEKPKTKPNRPTVLVLAPTRELAIQIGERFRTYGKHMKFRQALVYGGVGQGQQVKELKRGIHVLIATPGRLQDLMDQGHVSLDNIEIFVLDEADRMLDMGFLPALKKIIAKVPQPVIDLVGTHARCICKSDTKRIITGCYTGAKTGHRIYWMQRINIIIHNQRIR